MCASVASTVWFYPEDYGISSACFARTYFAGFTYRMGTAVADAAGAGTVTVPITVTCHPASELVAALEGAAAAAREAGADITQEGAADSAFEAYVAEHPFTVQEVEMDVVVTKDDEGDWVARDGNALASLLLGGYNPKQDAL